MFSKINELTFNDLLDSSNLSDGIPFYPLVGLNFETSLLNLQTLSESEKKSIEGVKKSLTKDVIKDIINNKTQQCTGPINENDIELKGDLENIFKIIIASINYLSVDKNCKDLIEAEIKSTLLTLLVWTKHMLKLLIMNFHLVLL